MTHKTCLWLVVAAFVSLLAAPASVSASRVERLEEGRWRIVESTRFPRHKGTVAQRARQLATTLCARLGYSHMRIDPASVSYRRARSAWSRPPMRRPSRFSLEVQFLRQATEGTETCAPPADPQLQSDVDRKVVEELLAPAMPGNDRRSGRAAMH